MYPSIQGVFYGYYFPALAGYLILLLVVLWVARAGARRALEVNPAVGIRTAETTKNPEAWKLAYQAFWPYALPVAVTCAVFIIALTTLNSTTFCAYYLGVMMIVSYAVLIGIVVAGGIAANKAAKDFNETPGSNR